MSGQELNAVRVLEKSGKWESALSTTKPCSRDRLYNEAECGTRALTGTTSDTRFCMETLGQLIGLGDSDLHEASWERDKVLMLNADP